jgi:hypothetical protein
MILKTGYQLLKCSNKATWLAGRIVLLWIDSFITSWGLAWKEKCGHPGRLYGLR